MVTAPGEGHKPSTHIPRACTHLRHQAHSCWCVQSPIQTHGMNALLPVCTSTGVLRRSVHTRVREAHPSRCADSYLHRQRTHIFTFSQHTQVSTHTQTDPLKGVRWVQHSLTRVCTDPSHTPPSFTLPSPPTSVCAQAAHTPMHSPRPAPAHGHRPGVTQHAAPPAPPAGPHRAAPDRLSAGRSGAIPRGCRKPSPPRVTP